MLLCAIILGFIVVDTLYLDRFSAWALGLRVVWTLNIIAYPLLVRRSSDSWLGPLTDLNALISSVCILGLCWVMGGVGSPYFIIVSTQPLATSLVHHRRRRATLVSGSVCCVGTLVLLRSLEPSPIEALTWMSMMVGMTLLAVYFSQQSLKVQQAEHQARLERARRESLEALALSEHRRAQSEKLAIVGRLASGVAHEINNPLAYVGSNVDFVRKELLATQGEASREELAEVLAETRVGIQHIHQVVADLRGFARMDANEPTECRLADVVADAMKLASLRLKNVALRRVDVPLDLPEIFVVRQRLVQVVLNLLVNAGDALESHKVERGEVGVVGRVEGGRVVLLVEDNGPGFPPHVLSRIFEAFFTTKSPDKGTGLGLNLSRELVEQFGGTLTASNRAQGGACLRIELPAHQDDSSEDEEREPEQKDQEAVGSA
ncbi:HAMP domain-containing histidine kinase [Archangium violaceum]|uniref:sensor histidine kinase n=1 Tax=Archangium violaceum TaxID=83451 RepID=UPI00194F37CF|nr:HAMP domain-containing sensor histidine kinase [Archangium violaceum]QRO00964.1 HAMP domain-containing histidine kinase [Archangium violaceum]